MYPGDDGCFVVRRGLGDDRYLEGAYTAVARSKDDARICARLFNEIAWRMLTGDGVAGIPPGQWGKA